MRNGWHAQNVVKSEAQSASNNLRGNEIVSPQSKLITLDQSASYAQETLKNELTQDIDDVNTCLELSRGTSDPHVALEYLQRAIDLAPDDPRAQTGLLKLLRERLNQDPYILFLAETEKNYVVSFRRSRPILVPKTRREPEIFPSLTKTGGERVLGMIWWMALGMVPAGLGAVILFPSVVRDSVDVLTRQGALARDQRMALVALALACALGCSGAFLGLLLFLHLLA